MEVCRSCGQVVRLVNRRSLKNKDTLKLIKIMEKNNLSVQHILNILGISKRTLMRWLSLKNGKIKTIYFEMLSLKGYE